jgi:predicted SnoaL-like aldol condensation-catalyzing enzyme
VPKVKLQNKFIIKGGIKYPGNEHIGAFGCDSYDISGTVDGKGSKGALHGLTKFSMEDAPPNTFFLEYLARPQTAEIFFEDVLMALVFYGMPMLAENNKPRLLYYLKRRGYRGYSMNRPDKVWNKLSSAEREIGGIPNSSEDIRQAHAAAIESYISQHVGHIEDGKYGNIIFNTTLNDWAKFDINKRTKFDAAISSGLAIMACNRHLYTPKPKKTKTNINFGFAKYDNKGISSKLI